MSDSSSPLFSSGCHSHSRVGSTRRENLQSHLCRNLRRLAHERQMTLSTLAEKAGVAKAQIYRVVSGQSSPSLDWIGRLARGLDVDAITLLTPSIELPSGPVASGYATMSH
ncbi:MAG: helix-turn-helix transcriptional regulator [Myxococcales bacterium FL481]|nr:MAG: helix-turn-helix transcriptional regulator [Myxococcales bacterium FL481]